MARLSPLSFVLLTLSILQESISAETLTNPTQGTHHCGLATECTIICNEFLGCTYSVYHVHNSTVSIQCIGSNACDEITVIAHNVEQLNITAYEHKALGHSKIIVDSTNMDVYTTCGTEGSDRTRNDCEYTTFHYKNQGKATHKCYSPSACTHATIHAATTIDLYCYFTASPGGCGSWATVIWPTDPILIQQSRFIHHADFQEGYNSGSTRLVIPNTKYSPNIECLGNVGCNHWHLYPICGITLSHVHPCTYNFSSSTLITAYDDVMNASTFVSDYYQSGTEYEFDQNTLFVITEQLHGGSLTFTSQNNAFISVLSIFVGYDPFTFDFSSVADVAITYIRNNENILLYGPSNSFVGNHLHGSTSQITMHLKNTPNVVLNGLPIDSYDIYFDKQENVAINAADGDSRCFGVCRANDSVVNVWSTISVQQQDLLNYGWIISCSQEEIDTCFQFMYNPTVDPTTAPTFAPTDFTANPTAAPTIPPTIAPTLNPTHSPSYHPTFSPTFSPSFAPTLNPTLAPTDYPTEAPSNAPTLNPTLSPTNYPTEAPSNAPTRAPTSSPTAAPTTAPIDAPTSAPTSRPTMRPISEAEVIEELETTNAVVTTIALRIDGDGSLTNVDSFIVSNAKMIIYGLLGLLVLSCVIIVVVCKKRGNGNNDNEMAAVAIEMAPNSEQEGDEPGLPNANILQYHTQSAVVPALPDSSDDDSDSLYEAQNKETEKCEQYELADDEDENDEDENDDLYDVIDPPKSRDAKTSIDCTTQQESNNDDSDTASEGATKMM